MKTLHIFLKNKLVALDSIMPLAHELHIEKSCKVIFYTFDKSIKHALSYNVFLNDLIKKMGGIKYLGTSNESRSIFKKVYASFILVYLFIRVLFTREKLIHFGILEKYPFRLLYCINKKNTFFSCKDVFGPFSNEAINISIEQGAGKDRKIDINNRCKSIAAKNIIAYSGDWEYLNCNNVKYKYKYEYPRRQKHWIDYAKSVSDYYFTIDSKDSNIMYENGIITFILGHVGYPQHGDDIGHSRTNAVYAVLESLSELSIDFPVYIKPHIFCDVHIVEKFVKKLSRKKNVNMHFTTLHPSILALKSKFAISIGGSTTLGDFFLAGVPTIDYSIMNRKELKIAGNKSSNDRHVVYFVNRDPEDIVNQKKSESELNKVIKKATKSDKIPKFYSSQDNKLLIRALSI